MKKYLIICLSIVIFIFSYLYSKRIDKVSLFSAYQMQFINEKDDSFCLNLYTNKEKSIYTNSNNITCELYLNDELNKIMLNNINVVKEDNLYTINYIFDMISVKYGLYETKFVLKTSEEKMTFELGSIYFKETEINDLSYSCLYNLQDNIKEIHIKLKMDLDIEKILLFNKVISYDIKPNNLTETKEIILYPSNNLFLTSLLISINDMNYIVLTEKTPTFYLVEGSYDNN